MRTSEAISVLVFVGVIAVIYVAAVGICVVAVSRRIRRKKVGMPRWRKWIRRVVLALAAIGILCVAYAFFIEPYWPEVTHVAIATDKLPAGSRPIRIVHISDLHSDPKIRLEGRLPEIIAAQNPDAIVFTGDAANSMAGLPVFTECITPIAQIAPTYAVTGNWDRWLVDPESLYAGTGVTLLAGHNDRLAVGDAEICILGVSYGQPLPAARTRDGAGADFTLLLCHTPDMARSMDLTGIDLVCAGHTHGGQVALPLWGPLVTLTRHGDGRGRYQIGQSTLYVNRGIGMEGKSAPRVRFCSRPEVTVYQISPSL